MKKRLDVLIYEKGFAESREKAKVLIMAGEIYVNGQKEDKAGSTFEEDVLIEHRGRAQRYVSRGGLKLEKAMQTFPIRLEGRMCMDIGASTGGFTDCMLQNGASGVFAVDVGYGQLAWKLRSDPRVRVLEKTNARYLDQSIITEQVDFVSVDVSFISLTLILPAMKRVMAPDGQAVCLIKPQFEAGRDKVGKKGVVRDRDVHREVIDKVAAFAVSAGFEPAGLTYSPVKGPEGNIEYLIWLVNSQADSAGSVITPELILRTVDAAHEELD